MNFRRFAVCLGVGLAVWFASVAIYVLTTRQHRRKKVFSDTFSPRRSGHDCTCTVSAEDINFSLANPEVHSKQFILFYRDKNNLILFFYCFLVYKNVTT